MTAVSERADLFAQAMASHLEYVDRLPARIIVHEDVRCDGHGLPRAEPGAIDGWLRRHARHIEVVHRVTCPAQGLGPAMRWCFRASQTPIVLYAQEDCGLARPLPIGRSLEIMEAHGLHHVRYNHRTTLPCKHGDKGRNPNPWRKVEVLIGGQVFCITDHWYTQTSLWRVAPALAGMEAVLSSETISNSNQFAARFNHWMNTTHGDGRPWNDQAMRHERLKTYIWGGIGEPAFLTNLDPNASRTTGPPR